MMKYQRKWAMLSLLVLGAALICHGSASAQTKGGGHAAPQASGTTGVNLPLWEYTTTSPADGNTYTGWMVGRSPYAHGMRTTNIQTFIVPLIVNVSDGLGGTFDPTVADGTCLGGNVPLTLFQQSPVLTSTSLSFGPTNVGTTQYPDAFQRGNFWNSPANVAATGNAYHTLLTNATTLAAQTITIPSGLGESYAASAFNPNGCGNFAVVDYNTINTLLANTVIPNIIPSGVNPSALVIFLTSNVVEAYPGEQTSSNCCSLGFHAAGTTAVSPNTPVQTYVAADFDGTGIWVDPNVSSAAYQISAWMVDPLSTAYNLAPAWSAPAGNVSLCLDSTDPGYPLLGEFSTPSLPTSGVTVVGSNDFTYNLPELAFFSWFYRQDPSIAVNNWYSSNNTLTTDAGAVCVGG
jgi:hypothetical protein